MKKYISEMIFTFIFVLVVLGVTDDKKGTPVMCGLAIGLTLVLVHIVCIPITGTSVNPARSIGPALFEFLMLPGTTVKLLCRNRPAGYTGRQLYYRNRLFRLGLWNVSRETEGI